MANRFFILGSSSSGNASVIQTDDATIMIDAGFSAKKIEELLSQCNISLNQIDAVFLTHEHSDHAIGIRGLSRKRPELPFYANEQTAQAIQKNLPRQLNWQIFQTGSSFHFKNLEVLNFSIPHDAYDPVGFIFEIKSPSSTTNPRLAWVTDLGYIPKLVQEHIKSVNYLVLESNYDPELLDNNPNRPWSIKQRIKSRHGHLSNIDSYEFLSQNHSSSWQKIFLAHLSKECNDILKVEKQFQSINNNSSFDINIIDPYGSCITTCNLI